MTTSGRLLICSLAVFASCARPSASQGAGNQFGVITSEGTVIAVVEGMAKGVTNSELTRLVRDGMAATYPIRCQVPPDVSATVPQMIWHVTSDPRKPSAIITVQVTQFGKMDRREYSRAPSPGLLLDATFKYAVADLARRVLDPPGAPTGQPISCS